MHELASGLRKAGQPVWQHHIDVSDAFHNTDLEFEQRRDQIVHAFKTSAWVKSLDDFHLMHTLLDELGDMEDEDSFDIVWNAIYDECDYARTWIKTF